MPAFSKGSLAAKSLKSMPMARQDFDPPIDVIRLAAQQGQAHVQALQDDMRQLMGLLDHTAQNMTQVFERLHASPDNAPGDADMRDWVTSLQFHDLASQIGQRMDLRLDGVAALWDTLETHSAMQSYPRVGLLVAQNDSLLQRLRRSVDQTDLSTGSVELF
jgi:hypothetical protein